jgi:hypothetical protein
MKAVGGEFNRGERSARGQNASGKTVLGEAFDI